jgi:hypothetical protein
MAKPIKDTPTLKGKDANRFSADIKANESKKVNEADYKKMLASYTKINNSKVE